MPGTEPRSRTGQIAQALVAMLAVSIVAGVMIAVAVTPAIAVTGGSAKDGTGLFGDVPADLAIAKLDQKTEIYAKDGDKDVRIASFYAQNREVVGWDQISAVVKNAAVAGEDVRYYEHGAVDPVGIARATVANLMGKDLQGASTITQQYVKNVCVQEAENLPTQQQVAAAYAVCTDASVGRKLREARYAIALEKKYSKDQILLGYLNIAGFGGQVYGIESAAKYYFDTDAKDLTVAQAASLMAIVNNPQSLRLDEKDNIARNTERRDYILGVELRNHLITQAQYDEAKATRTEPKITPTASGCQTAGSAAFFCDYVVNTVLTDKAFGATAAARQANLETAGWKIHTTLDLAAERKAKTAMSTYVPSTAPTWNVGGAAVSVEVGTGRILTMVTNKRFTYGKGGAGSTGINYTANSALGHSGGFQPGSTFKVFTLLDWLKSGRNLNESVDSDPGTVTGFTACGQPSSASYEFGNDTEGEGGYQTVLNGTAQSINGTFVRMAQQLDLCDIQRLAEDFGVKPVSGEAKPESEPSFIIGGAYTVSPVSIAAAYAGIANEGKYCSPVAIEEVVRTDGSKLAVPGTSCKQVIDPAVANAAVYALRGVFQGNGTAGGDNTADGLYEFGKTGTTDDAIDTWMTGSTSKVTTSVWVGNLRQAGTAPQSLRLTSFAATPCYTSGNGSAAAARHCVWKDVQTAVNADHGGATTWTEPEQQYLYGAPAVQQPPATGTVPDVTGQTKEAASQALVAAGFSWAYGPDEQSAQPAGVVARTDPAAGSQVAPGTQITIYGSTGP